MDGSGIRVDSSVTTADADRSVLALIAVAETDVTITGYLAAKEIMAEETKIAWTMHTMNPFMGCLKVAVGCKNCYAETLTKNRMGISVWGPNSRRQMTGPSIWNAPKKWNKAAQAAGIRSRVFCASLCDIFEDFSGPVTNAKEQPLWISRDGQFITPATPEYSFREMRPLTLDDLRRRLFAIIDETPWLDWQLLTKRPENIIRMWPERSLKSDSWFTLTCALMPAGFRPNVWIGTSVSVQSDADKNIPELLKCRDLAPVLFVSYEPALGQIDFTRHWYTTHNWHNWLTGETGMGRTTDNIESHPETGCKLDWLICGGESGPGYRPMDLDWARSARDQCRAAGVPFFFKQSAAPRTEMGIELDGQIVRKYPLVNHS